MEDGGLSAMVVEGRGQMAVKDLEAGTRSRKNKAGGTERGNTGIGGEVRTERGIEIEDVMVKKEPGVPQGAEREAHAGTETIDSIDLVSPARNPTRDLQRVPTSLVQTLLKNFLKPSQMFQHLPLQPQQTQKPQNLLQKTNLRNKHIKKSHRGFFLQQDHVSISHFSANHKYCWLESKVQLLWDALCIESLVLHHKPSFSDFIKRLLANVERCLVNLLYHLNEA